MCLPFEIRMQLAERRDETERIARTLQHWIDYPDDAPDPDEWSVGLDHADLDTLISRDFTTIRQ